MAIVCLALGVIVGFLVHGPTSLVPLSSSVIDDGTVGAPSQNPNAPPLPNTRLSSAKMTAAGAQAALPVLEQLEAKPKDFKLLVEAGEMYYHHGEYVEAEGFYKRALAVENNFAVRNQYASALFYAGDADGALREYASVLREHPTNDVALFNSGMIKYKFHKDRKGAIELWRKLLKAHPNHPQRDRVKEMIQEASSH